MVAAFSCSLVCSSLLMSASSAFSFSSRRLLPTLLAPHHHHRRWAQPSASSSLCGKRTRFPPHRSIIRDAVVRPPGHFSGSRLSPKDELSLIRRLSARRLTSLFSTTTSREYESATMTDGSNDSGRMIVVLSPAKTMDLRPLSERDFPPDAAGDDDEDYVSMIFRIRADVEPDPGKLCDASKTRTISSVMKSKSKAQLKSLLGLSDNLAKAAHKYWTDFEMDDGDGDDADPPRHLAMYTFSGPAFQGLDPMSCDAATLTNLASRLFVLDPVYGALRGLQGMRPYRLEMGCKLLREEGGPTRKKGTLAGYWSGSVTEYLGTELTKGVAVASATTDAEGCGGPEGTLVNLASEEYSSSIDPASLPPNTVYLNVVFRHKGRVLAVHAKRARGLMARYVAERGASTLEEVSEFDAENYRCVGDADGTKWNVEDTVGENVRIVRMVFDREDAPPKETAAEKKKRAATGSKKGGGRKASGKKAKK